MLGQLQASTLQQQLHNFSGALHCKIGCSRAKNRLSQRQSCLSFSQSYKICTVSKFAAAEVTSGINAPSLLFKTIFDAAAGGVGGGGGQGGDCV